MLVLPVDYGRASCCDVVLDKRFAKGGLVDLRRNQIVEVPVFAWILEEVSDGMRTVFLQIIFILSTECVDEVAVQVAFGHCEQRWWLSYALLKNGSSVLWRLGDYFYRCFPSVQTREG